MDNAVNQLTPLGELREALLATLRIQDDLDQRDAEGTITDVEYFIQTTEASYALIAPVEKLREELTDEEIADIMESTITEHTSKEEE
jgi:hypothetical protein